MFRTFAGAALAVGLSLSAAASQAQQPSLVTDPAAV
jgi:hypothetical protein